MRAHVTRLEIDTLEERLLAGSYFGTPTGDGGVTSPLATIPRRRAAVALVKAPARHHPGTPEGPSEAAESLVRRHRAAALGFALTGNVDPATTPAAVPVVADGSLVPLPAGGTSTDQSLALAPIDLTVGLTPADGGAGTARGGDGSLSGGTGLGTVNLVSSGGPGSIAPGDSGGVAGVPPVTINPAGDALSQDTFSQNTLVVVALGSKGSHQGTGSPPPQSTDGLVIPTGHPRVWFNNDPRLIAQAQAFYAQYPIHASTDDPLGSALLYALTGDPTAGAIAVNAVMSFTISDSELQSVASDNYRWNGWVPIAYDWVHDALTPAQRQTFTDRYNYYAFTMMNKPWGGPSMPGNNYFWGYFANEFNWAIATYYDNPMAQTFLDDALITRWQNGFVPWAETQGKGGVFGEGTEYMMADLDYPSLPLAVAAMMGGDQYGQTNFYKEAIFNEIYSTTPAPTYSRESPANPYYMPFPFGENEHSGGYPNLETTTAYGNFMLSAAGAYSNLPVGQYAYHWLQMVQPYQTPYTIPYYMDTPGWQLNTPTPDFHRLPLDYYAPGVQYFYTRNQWGPQATSVFLQLGQAGDSHANTDAGSFQIWRNSWFVSKETTGYDLQINGGMSEDPIAHNTLLFNGQGIARAWRNGDPQTIRLQTDPVFSYAAVDMSQAFGSSYATLANPYAAHAIREFIFIKPLETMVVLDRLESSSDAVPAQDVTKTFLLHFPNQPQVTGPHTVIGYSGDQALSLTTLVPSNPTFSVVDESAFSGPHDPDPAFYQYRLEENTSGSAQSYFLNVLQARDATGADVVSHMTQNAGSWTVTLDSATLGHAQIVLNKGMDSQGGAVGYSATGTPTEFTPLLDHVQNSRVTDYGPVWGS